MGENQTNLLQGTLDLLILKAIGDASFTGWGLKADRTDNPRDISREAGIIVPGAPPHGRGGLVDINVG